ncbi:CopG family transcriptional regulator [Paenibacillus paeoniae]|uniref:CopG family transcriptional regulator n=1 Tax=Paenibacillus paeoniae TaxID=2292705 RepID=A0A371PLV0_9BACL|nr:CopG family transcriptional regulator [Paenibacillus paeoniae]REK77158.1 CopG family transcriptional regulator [Paenibacillus paeoniae]
MSDKEVKVVLSNKEGQLGFSFTRGGLREGAGRKAIGVTKKVSVTLPQELWDRLENDREENRLSRSEMMRLIIETYYADSH